MIKNISSKNVTLEPSLFKNRAEHNFTRLEKNKAIWSPQYTMHKTLMELLDAYRFADNQQALEIIKSQADWYVDWTQQMVKVNPDAIYSGEEGGMLEIWLTLYELTKDEKYMELAHQYDHPELSINGKQLSIDTTSTCEYDVKLENGFLKLTTSWKQDEIEVFFPSCVKAVGLPDVPDEFALVDGPIVLAGLSDSQIKISGDSKNPSTFLLAENTHTYEDFPWQQNHYRTIHQAKNIDFVPLYEITDEAYTVYFEIK